MQNVTTIILIVVTTIAIAIQIALVALVIVLGYNTFLALWNWTGELLLKAIIPSRSQLTFVIASGFLAPVMIFAPIVKPFIKIMLNRKRG